MHCSRADLAVPVSLVIFIIAWVFIMVLSFGFPYNGTTHQGIVAVFSLFPWSLLSKGLLDLANATTGVDGMLSMVFYTFALQSSTACQLARGINHVMSNVMYYLHTTCREMRKQ